MGSVENDGLHALTAVGPHRAENNVGRRDDAASFQADQETEGRHRMHRMASVEPRIDKLVLLEQEEERSISYVAVGQCLEHRDLTDVSPLDLLGAFGTRANPAVAARPVPLRDVASTFRETARSGLFWSLLGTFAVCGASTGGLIQAHLVPLCADYAVASGQATAVLALIGLLAFAGTSISGWLSDRFDAGWLLFWFYGLRGLSLVVLSFSEISFAGLSLFAVLYGLDWTATVPPTARLVVARFGPQRASLVFGWVFTGHQLGGAVAAFGAGTARTGLGSYLPALLVTGSLCLMASAAILSLSARLCSAAAEANDGP